jgi:hypothetical protein
MAHEMIHGSYRQTNLQNESADYLSKREELRLAEIDLMRQRDLDGRSTALLVVKKLRAKTAKLRKE